MFKNNRIPKFPDSYVGSKSQEYNNSKWMERNQKKTTLLAIQYLYDKKLDLIGEADGIVNHPHIVLDLGCGTGFSSEILAEHGFRIIGIDILKDMLFKANYKRKEKSQYKDIFLLLADINHLPLKQNSVDHIISISAYNFIIDCLFTQENETKILNETASSFYSILKKNGRVIIEFYPNDENELDLFSSSLKKNGFDGFMLKPTSKKSLGQYFLLLKKI